MKHATIVAAALVLVAGGCKSKSEEGKGAATATAEVPKTDAAATDTAKTDTAPKTDTPTTDTAKTDTPTAVPLSDAQCKDVVLAIVACRSTGDDDAKVAFDDWLLQRFYGGTGIALLDPLQDEMDAWKKDPAKACADWRTWRAPEPFPDGVVLHAAAKAADCGAMRSVIDAAGGIPVAPDAQ